ncbi:MAG TPA: (2Fe-2S)-binding protein [Sphingobacteriaceae bacterium]|nr:(2Fe-2S)-binding protein [Sphingobacteriaceae bacterium]
MKRDEFLTTLGIGFTAICTGCLASCGKSDNVIPSGGSGGGIIPPANVNFNVDLDTELLNVGDSKINSGVILVRIAAGNAAPSFTAVQLACSHEGTSIGYAKNQGQFVCPNHGSTFSNSGTVVLGPATTNLKKYTVAVSGSALTVSS